MRLLFGLAFSAFLIGPALAQTQQPTPSQLALQIDNVVNGMAQMLEQMQQQNAQLQARVKELEEKLKESQK